MLLKYIKPVTSVCNTGAQKEEHERPEVCVEGGMGLAALKLLASS